jgi:gliding motility-associated protein GldC
MRRSTILFKIDLDENNLPDKITWKASDKQDIESNTKAVAVSLWDPDQQNTLKIDLWTKDMRVEEMDKFLVDTLGGLSQTMLNATGDTFISNSINTLCDQLATHIKNKTYG